MTPLHCKFSHIRILANSYSNNEYSLMTKKYSNFEFYSCSFGTLPQSCISRNATNLDEVTSPWPVAAITIVAGRGREGAELITYQQRSERGQGRGSHFSRSFINFSFWFPLPRGKIARPRYVAGWWWWTSKPGGIIHCSIDGETWRLKIHVFLFTWPGTSLTTCTN